MTWIASMRIEIKRVVVGWRPLRFGYSMGGGDGGGNDGVVRQGPVGGSAGPPAQLETLR